MSQISEKQVVLVVGVFPVRLRDDEWTGGEINWLLDVIAPNERMATAVIANFKQVIKEVDLRMHPIVGKVVGKEALAKMGATASSSRNAETDSVVQKGAG